MTKTQAGRETWAFICWHVAPGLPRVTTKTQIIAAADVTFQVGDEFPASRVREASQERNGEKVQRTFVDRARELGLREMPAPSPWKRETEEAAYDEREYVKRLQDTATRLRHSGTEFGCIEADNLEYIIGQISGRIVAGAPVRR